MLQRHAGPYPLIFPTLDPPVELHRGGEIDHPELLAGFEPVESAEAPGDDDQDDQQDDDTTPDDSPANGEQEQPSADPNGAADALPAVPHAVEAPHPSTALEPSDTPPSTVTDSTTEV